MSPNDGMKAHVQLHEIESCWETVYKLLGQVHRELQAHKRINEKGSVGPLGDRVFSISEVIFGTMDDMGSATVILQKMVNGEPVADEEAAV